MRPVTQRCGVRARDSYLPSGAAHGIRAASLHRIATRTAQPQVQAQRSVLGRGFGLAVAAFALNLFLANQTSLTMRCLMFIPFLLALAATIGTVRSMRVTWDLRHGGVLLLLYADMMLLTLIAVWTIWPM